MKKQLLKYCNYLFDLDGTIYLGKTAINGAIETINKLKHYSKKVYFISNNSSKNKNEYTELLIKLGIQCDTSDVFLSTDFAIDYLKYKNVNKAYVLGNNSLQNHVKSAGIKLCSNNPEIILVGYDTELTYDKLVTACYFIHRGVRFIATHCDMICPSEHGNIPDIGLLIYLLENTTNKKVYKIFGKPNKEVIDIICRKKSLDKSKTLVIGDRLYTDILMSVNAKVDSLLVLSGDTKKIDIQKTTLKPTFIRNSVADIFK